MCKYVEREIVVVLTVIEMTFFHFFMVVSVIVMTVYRKWLKVFCIF